MPTQPLDANRVQKKIRRRLNKLEKLSPTQIKQKIAGHRSGFSQPPELLARWLCEELDLERMTIKTHQNVVENLEVVLEFNGISYTFKFYVKTSLQDYLGILKTRDVVAGVKLTDEQAILVRAIIDRDGGNEAEFLSELLNSALADSVVVKRFVKRLKDHPDWHQAMHNAGLYPADIFSAYKKVRQKVKSK